jgi:hypothetical protein
MLKATMFRRNFPHILHVLSPAAVADSTLRAGVGILFAEVPPGRRPLLTWGNPHAAMCLFAAADALSWQISKTVGKVSRQTAARVVLWPVALDSVSRILRRSGERSAEQASRKVRTQADAAIDDMHHDIVLRG